MYRAETAPTRFVVCGFDRQWHSTVSCDRYRRPQEFMQHTLSKASGDEVLDGFAAEVRFFKIFIYLTVLHLSCIMWDLVPWPRIKLRPPALGTQNFSHWTTWEILQQKLGLLQTPGLGLQTGSVGHWVGWPRHQWAWKTLLPLHGSPAAESRISTIPTKKPQPSTFSATSTQNITWINSCKNPKS